MNEKLNMGGGVVRVELEPEVVFTEAMPDGEMRVMLAPVRGVPHVTLPAKARGVLTAVMHQSPGRLPEIIAFYSSEHMARLQTHLATEGFRALAMLHDATRQLLAQLEKPSLDVAGGIAATEAIDATLAAAKIALQRGAELADVLGDPEDGH